MAELLVQKPQFNTQELCPGTPVQITHNSNFFERNIQRVKKGIIVEAEPLKLKVHYWKEDQDRNSEYQDLMLYVLAVDQVANESEKIEILKVPPDKGILESSLKDLVGMVKQANEPVAVFRSQITMVSRLLGLDPENIKPDWLKEDSLLNE